MKNNADKKGADNADIAFGIVLGHAAKGYVEETKSSDTRFMLAVAVILTFLGHESVRILFRKNFGMTPLGWVKMVLCVLCFSGISIFSFTMVNSQDSFALEYGTPDSHFITGILYAILAITILCKGILDRNKTDKHYEGDSDVLGFLSKNQALVKYLYEPLLILIIGLAACLFDLMGGIPVIFCALSVWGYVLFEAFFQHPTLENSVEQVKTKENKLFHQVD